MKKIEVINIASNVIRTYLDYLIKWPYVPFEFSQQGYMAIYCYVGIYRKYSILLQKALNIMRDNQIIMVGGFGLVKHMQYANSVSELLLPSLPLRILQRFAAEINVNLDTPQLSSRSEVRSFAVSGNIFELIDNKLYVHGNSIALESDEDELFRWIADKITSTRYNALNALWRELFKCT